MAEDELFAPNFVYHDPLSGEDWHGSQSVKRYAAMMHAVSRLFYRAEVHRSRQAK
ncbi:MAG: hypothetical protein M3266_04995 [Actinomycetota bacterium]|nr:hypothetical protein [Actinomycetota bacterium]